MRLGIKITILVLSSVLLSSCTAQQEPTATTDRKSKDKPESKTENLATFLILGEIAPVGYTEEQDSVITQHYGFTIKRVADCEVTDELLTLVKIANEKNDALMQQRYGKDWIANFEQKSNLKLAVPYVGSAKQYD